MKTSSARWQFQLLGAAMLLALGVSVSGCGSSSTTTSNPPPAVSISLSQAPPASLSAGATAMVAATVTNDSAAGGVDWSCAPAGSCGSFSPAHTASGATTTYTAPSTAPGGGNATITATASSDHTKTAAATVAISAASAVAISLTTAPPASLAVGGTASISATVTNDTASAGVDWTCTPAGTCGTFSPAHTASGATTTYTAPGAAVAAVITATATSSSSATATANVSVTAVNGTALSSGTYTFAVNGEDSKKNTYAITGAFVLGAAGAITGGEQDYVSAGGAASPQPGGDTIMSGTLTVGANGLGTLTLVTNNSAVGVAGTETFSVSQVNGKHAVIGEFDSSATSSGTLDFQTLAATTLAQVSGPFVFTVSGKSGSKAEVFGGLLSSNGAGNLATSDIDQNSGGAISRGGSNTGTYTAPDATGRGTMTFGGNHYRYYVVNAKVLRLVVVDAGEPTVGTAYAGVSGVTNANLANSFLFVDSSNLSAGASFAAAGKLTMDASGHVTGGFADVQEGATSTSAAVTGTYSVNGSGYGTITITPGTTQNLSVLSLYLTDPTINPTDPNSPADAGLAGLLIDLDTNLIGGGWLILPAAGTPSFTAGNFALAASASNANNELDAVGVVAVNGTSLTGVANVNDLFNSVLTGQNAAAAISGTLVPDGANAGRFTISVAETLGTTPPTLKFVIYQASNSQLIVLQVDATQFASGTLQKQQ